jgi:hypothetical protein
MMNIKINETGINVFYEGFLVYVENLVAPDETIPHKALRIAKEIRQGNYPEGLIRQIEIADMIIKH